jgi:hypothetical protein
MFTLAPAPGTTDAAFLSVVFAGEVTLAERREAFGLAVEAALAGDISRVLIDFSQADIAPYPVIDGVKYAWHAAQLAFIDRIAYLAPGHEADLAISLLRNALDIDVRVFRDREDAHAWLVEAGAHAAPQTGNAPLASCR